MPQPSHTVSRCLSLARTQVSWMQEILLSSSLQALETLDSVWASGTTH